MSYHDMRGFFSGSGRPVSERFDLRLREAATAEPERRDQLLERWSTGTDARNALPREEHLLPLMVVAGAAGSDRGRVGFDGSFANARISAYEFG